MLFRGKSSNLVQIRSQSVAVPVDQKDQIGPKPLA
jgi:hypothetical protein